MKPHIFTSEDPMKLGDNEAICLSPVKVGDWVESVEGEISQRKIREVVEAIPRLCWRCRKKALSEEVNWKRYFYVGVEGQESLEAA